MSAQVAKPRKFLMRRWLNRRGKQSVAFVYADLCAESYLNLKDSGKKGERRYIEGEVTIGDCNRQITLTIEADDNTVEKLELLSNALLDVRDWLVEARGWRDGV